MLSMQWTILLIPWLVSFITVFSIPQVKRPTVTSRSTNGYYYQQFYSNADCTGTITYVKGVQSQSQIYSEGSKAKVCIPSDTRLTQQVMGSAAYYCNDLSSTYGRARKLVVNTYNSTDCSGDPWTTATYAMGFCAPSIVPQYGSSFRSLCNFVPALPLNLSTPALVRGQYRKDESTCGGETGLAQLPFAFEAWINQPCKSNPVITKSSANQLWYTCGASTYQSTTSLSQVCLFNTTLPSLAPPTAVYGPTTCGARVGGLGWNMDIRRIPDLPSTTGGWELTRGLPVQTGYDCGKLCAAMYPECVAQRPTSQPTSQPNMKPSGQPSRRPSSKPSAQPAMRPSGQPTRQPTRQVGVYSLWTVDC